MRQFVFDFIPSINGITYLSSIRGFDFDFSNTALWKKESRTWVISSQKSVLFVIVKCLTLMLISPTSSQMVEMMCLKCWLSLIMAICSCWRRWEEELGTVRKCLRCPRWRRWHLEMFLFPIWLNLRLWVNMWLTVFLSFKGSTFLRGKDILLARPKSFVVPVTQKLNRFSLDSAKN